MHPSIENGEACPASSGLISQKELKEFACIHVVNSSWKTWLEGDVGIGFLKPHDGRCLLESDRTQ